MQNLLCCVTSIKGFPKKIRINVYIIFKIDSETAGRDPDFHESYVNPRKERHLIRLKVSGTCLFIAIADGHASLEVSKLAKDVDKFSKH